MLTLGSKVFFGGSLVAAIAAVGYAFRSPDQVGTLLLVGTVLAAAGIGCAILYGAGASDRYSYAGGEDQRPSRYPKHTLTPIISAVSVGALVLGLALGTSVLVLAGAAILVCAAVWFSEAWRDHPDYVKRLTDRVSSYVGLPFGMPVAVLALAAIVAISVSRTFLAVDHTVAWIIAAVVAVAVFVGAFVLAAGPKLDRTARNVIAATTAIAILGLGAYGLSQGTHKAEHEGGHEAGVEHSTEKGEAPKK